MWKITYVVYLYVGSIFRSGIYLGFVDNKKDRLKRIFDNLLRPLEALSMLKILKYCTL